MLSPPRREDDSPRARRPHATLLVFVALGLAMQGCAVGRPLPPRTAIDAALDPPPPLQARPSPELGGRLPDVQREIEDIGHLTYDDAALVALAVNPALRSARAERGIAQAQVIEAGLVPNPQFTGALDVPTDGPVAGTNPAYSVELAWELSPLLARGAAVGAERAGLEAVELDVAWQEWQAAEEARLGVVRLAMLERRLALARQTEAAMASQVATLQAAVDAGNATSLELAAAESSLQAASMAALQLVQAQRAARLEWLAALGLPPTSGVRLAEDPHLPAVGKLPDLAVLLDALPEARLDLRGMRRAYDAEDGRVRAEALRAFPAVNVAVRRSVDSSNLGAIGVGVTIDLPVFHRNQGAIALEVATRGQIEERYLARLQDARSQVARAHADLVSVREQAALVQSWVPTIQTLAGASEELLATGNVSIIDLYDLRVRLLDAQLLLLEFRQTELELYLALELASGVPWLSRSGAPR